MRNAWRSRRVHFGAALALMLGLIPVSNVSARGDECTPEWSGLAGPIPGADALVNAVAWFDAGLGAGPELFVGGSFTTIGGISSPRLAKFDGVNWIDIAEPSPNGEVTAMTAFNDGTGTALYVAGGFTSIGGVNAQRIAKWDGVSWSAVGVGFNGIVRALLAIDAGEIDGPQLIAGGEFTMSGEEFIFRVARWDTNEWSAMDIGMSGPVRALARYDDGNGPAIYAGGSFNEAGSPDTRALARWTGSEWTATGALFSPGRVVRALCVDGDSLVVGGYFSIAGGVPASNVARLTGTRWEAIGAGFDDDVHALAVVPSDLGETPLLCAGGDFLNSGGAPASHLAEWNGAEWSEVLLGADGVVTSIAPGPEGSGVRLSIGGNFLNVGGANGVLARRLASIEQGSWRAYGEGFNDVVRALAVFDDGRGPALFVGGSFTSVAGIVANRIARWDGTSWTTLGMGFDGAVHALAVFDDGTGPALYAGGAFTTADGKPNKFLARWDGTEWWNVGGGLSGGTGSICRTLLPVGAPLFTVPSLVIGGSFNVSGGFYSNLVTWDGTVWKNLPTGLSTQVETLATHDFGGGDGPRLYAGGTFQTLKRIVMLNASTWLTVGGGVTTGTSVLSFHSYDDGAGPSLFAGGRFSVMNDIPASAIARWTGAAWEPLGAGVTIVSGGGTLEVRALAHFDDGNGESLFAGGNFGTAGSVTAVDIAKWDGAAWHSLGSMFGPSGSVVNAMVEFDDDTGPALYVGGSFLASAAADSYLTKLTPCKADPCPLAALGDINCDQLINGADLAMILGAWGPCEGCVEDLNHDGVVDGADLAVVLGNWTG